MNFIDDENKDNNEKNDDSDEDDNNVSYDNAHLTHTKTSSLLLKTAGNDWKVKSTVLGTW